jgi:predicted RNase H-like nuclease (RuvC/YqgF family)
MGMTNGRTICSKHDEIMTLADEIESLCEADINPSDLSNLFSDLVDKAKTIYSLADAAKDDGQSMEEGLDNKKTRIQELEKEVSDMDSELRKLIGIDELYEEAQERIEELEEELLEAKITLEVE